MANPVLANPFLDLVCDMAQSLGLSCEAPAAHFFWVWAPTPPGPQPSGPPPKTKLAKCGLVKFGQEKLAKFGQIRMAKCGQLTLAKCGVGQIRFGQIRPNKDGPSLFGQSWYQPQSLIHGSGRLSLMKFVHDVSFVLSSD